MLAHSHLDNIICRDKEVLRIKK